MTKASTSINNSGLCKSKENVPECIANWLSLMNHNYNIDDNAPPLLSGTFFKLANLITGKEYKFCGSCLDSATVDVICNIEICTQLGSLGQIFAEPSLLYEKLTPKPDHMPTITPIKHPKLSPDKSEDSELVKKQRKARKEG
eukprot:7787306-Ditylum_brightwellii.AAC.1